MDRTNLNQEGWTRYAQYLGPVIVTLLLASVSSFAGALDHWIERNPLPTGNQLVGMTVGNGMFMAIAERGVVLTSVNGDEWNAQAQRPLANPLALAFGNGRFVTVGLDGIASSVDGVTWTKSPLAREITDSHGNPFLKEVVFGQGRFIALGDRPRVNETKLVVSTDGTTWSSANITNISVMLETMAYGKNTFVGAGA